MDQFDDRRPSWRTDSDTPVYDRLLAEWQEAARNREQTPASPSALSRSPRNAFVPGARTPAEAAGDRS